MADSPETPVPAPNRYRSTRCGALRPADIGSILEAYGGPHLFGEICMADAMYAPVVSRLRTYGVALDGPLKAYAERIWDLPAMAEWREAALAEREEIEELEVEF